MNKLQSIAERMLYILESPNLSRKEKLDLIKTKYLNLKEKIKSSGKDDFGNEVK